MTARQLDETAVNVFVDGSQKPSPRRGGVGLLFVWVDEDGNEQTEDWPLSISYEGTTNNRMEIQAVIDALKVLMSRASPVDLAQYRKIVIYSDSLYVFENFYNAMHNWPGRQWQTREGDPVLNVPRWKELRKLVNRIWEQMRMRVEIKWVPGKKDAYTKRVDQSAKKAADSPIKRSDEPSRIRRKWSPRSLERGSVSCRGREEIVRVVTDEYLRAHRVYRCMFEVVDPRSAHFQKVDYLLSATMLSAGHLYRLLFKDLPGDPKVEAVLEEFPREEYTYQDYVDGVLGPWEKAR
jgi:ribonuclease HI